MIESFKAGIINGFGLGGGMFLIPFYLSLGNASIIKTIRFQYDANDWDIFV